ncbi:MAG TPA: PstS family phosphate ABC transporter substrate-binding protein [Luteitalea sp.]|nr:PstS family phosphate ABC transporter substrate-binding protein [Luteitalea sp.]
MCAPLQRSACALALLAASGLAGCGSDAAAVRTVVAVDGSSTVAPLTEAVAEDFQRAYPGTRVTIGVAGTGGGFRRFCRGDVDVANASRPITRTETAACAAAGIRFLEVPVAYDGIVIAVHPSNTWVDALSVDDLRRLWRHEAEGQVLRWSQVRGSFPDREMHLFGAGVDSGTFDYFTGVVTGVPRDSRGDYTSSENDNTLVQGVATDPLALGYFGFAYFEEHREYLKAVPIVAAPGTTAVPPSRDAIRAGAYHPLSRPIFVYVNADALAARADLAAFVDYYAEHAADVADDVGYVALDAAALRAVRVRVAARTTGSLFGGRQDSASLARTLTARLALDPAP